MPLFLKTGTPHTGKNNGKIKEKKSSHDFSNVRITNHEDLFNPTHHMRGGEYPL